LDNLKLLITNANQGLSSFPSVSDLQASKQEQICLLTQMKKENLKSMDQFNNWLYACVS